MRVPSHIQPGRAWSFWTACTDPPVSAITAALLLRAVVTGYVRCRRHPSMPRARRLVVMTNYRRGSLSVPRRSRCAARPSGGRPRLRRTSRTQLPTCTRTSDASSQIDQPEAKVAKAWIMNEPLAGLGRVSKSASLLHGQRPLPGCPDRVGPEIISPVLASSIRSRDCFTAGSP